MKQVTYRRRKRSRAESDRTKGGNLERVEFWLETDLAEVVREIAKAEGTTKRDVCSRAIRALAAAVRTPVPGET